MGLFSRRREERNSIPKEPKIEGFANFEDELTKLINKYSLESLSNTPDFILAFYLKDCLQAFTNAQQRRKEWFSVREEEKNARASQLMPIQD